MQMAALRLAALGDSVSSRAFETALVFEGNPRGRIGVYEPFEAVRHQTSPASVTVPGKWLVIVVEE